jgi:hypothetical protein
MRTLQFLALIFVASAFTYPAKEIKLEYTFKVGDQYEFAQIATTKSKQNIPGMGEMAVDATVNATMLFRVIELTPTGAKIEAYYTKMKAATTSPMMNMTLDSEGSQDNIQNKLLKVMMDKKFTFNVSKRGLVEKVDGIENIYSGFSTLGLDEATLAQVRQSMQQTVSDKTIKTNLESGFILYPEKKVKESDTWKNTGDLVLNFTGKIENSYVFKKLDGDQATIESDGNITTVDKQKITSMPGGIKTKSDLAGRQVVSGKVDVKTGWPSEVKSLAEIKGQMKYLAGGMIPEDMDVPMEMTVEGTYTMTKK